MPGAGSAAPPPPLSPSAGKPPSSGLRKIVTDGALSMLGQPYRFGGESPGGFDCSGLVAYAAAGAGIRVPRTALEQWHSGIAVPRRAVQAGDLIFMHLAHKELHVGIALGDQRFIHAPSKGGRVRIDSLAAAPYAKRFLGARRIIPDPQSLAIVRP
jgi:cell wall-associated NlpC family hydrolase